MDASERRSSEKDRPSTSLEPERAPLLFNYDEAAVTTEMVPVMGQIKHLAQKMLYHWKEFPIILPPSITDLTISTTEKAKANFQDLFIAPTFDETEQVAKDPAGGLKKLNNQQLNSIWDQGEFEVDSINFPGQVHRWRLTQLLQKGTRRSHDTLLNDIALALRLLIITARNRFISNFFSLSQAFRGWGRGLWKILDILVGMPSTSPGDVFTKIREEHMRYLVAELVIKPKSRKEFEKFTEYVKEKCRLLRMEKHKTSDLRPPAIPYCYQTPQGIDIDLRLFNKDLINNCLPILSNILEREAKGWHIHYRQHLVQDLRGKGLSNEEISDKVNKAVMQEYLKRVFGTILDNAELENIQSGLGQLLVAQAKSVLAMQEATQNVQLKMQKHKEQLIDHLKKSYPVKSRIQPWMDEQLQGFEEEFVSQNLWSAHEEAISLCEEQKLSQTVYFLKRDLNFIKEREAVLMIELGKVKIPNRIFTFATKIWFPHNWVITRQYQGEVEIVPTVISETRPSTPSRLLKKEMVYTLDKYSRRKTSTQYPFWRWWNYLHRTWAWMWNSLFFFGVVFPWCSPLSFRALFYRRPFKPDLELSRVDGKLYPRDSSETETLCSRLTALWTNVRHSRRKFEDADDTGFLGKSFTRHLNRLWNYVVKGAFGSVALVVVFPAMCLTTSVLSILAGITAPVWIPFVTLGAHLAALFFYDFDCPDEGSNAFLILFEAIIWRILIQGCFQPVAAIIFGTICCPFASLGITLFGLIRRGGRGLWDTFMFHAVIKSRGRVPMKDGFVARRIAGPGLASNYFFQIQPEQALAALESSMELDELEAWKAQVLRVIEKPAEEYREFVQQCFRPFSADIINEGVFKLLSVETSQYINDLMIKVKEREKKLNTGLRIDVQRRIKLSEQELKLTILQAAAMIELFYPKHVLKRQNLAEADYWENQQLEFRDWRGLASKKLSDIFSKSFLVPLEDTDNHFELKVEHLNLSRYIDMLKTSKYRDDLDLVTEIHTPAGDVHVRAPFLDSGYFNPSQRMIHTIRIQTPRRRTWPWRGSWEQPVFDKLEIPLPIPHPATIAISVYNRENDQDPINFEDVYCQRIIRATKEVHDEDLALIVPMFEDIDEDTDDSEQSDDQEDDTLVVVGEVSPDSDISRDESDISAAEV